MSRRHLATTCVWLPYIEVGTGTDVFTTTLTEGFIKRGISATAQPFPKPFQFAPYILKAIQAPRNATCLITNSVHGFAFHKPSLRHVTVEHLCVHDAAYQPYKTRAQNAWHRLGCKEFERRTFAVADRVIAVSHYTARIVQEVFPTLAPHVIHNAVDCDFFSPADRERPAGTVFTLLFVGSLKVRKGADLLGSILRRLPDNIVIRLTATQEEVDRFDIPRAVALGSLGQDALREEYRNADALIFPTRLEGFPLAAEEAMACALPVIASNGSSLPELVEHECTGLLCTTDNTAEFASAVLRLLNDRDMLIRLGRAARARMKECFSLDRWVDAYCAEL